MQASGVSNRIWGFDYRNVTLKNSHWKKQLDETIEFYLAIRNDDLLHIFRVQAGIPSPVNGLAGWYGVNAHSFGQKLGAFAKLYRATGDYRLKEKAVGLAEGWIACAERSDLVYDHDTYVFDKLLGGFCDLYEYLGYEDIAPHMSTLTDFAIRRFKRDIKRDGLQDEGLWKNHMIEWYTLPEQLYRAYELTGEPKFRSFAEEWDYNYLWDKFLAGDFHIGPRHAYSQVNSLSSAARAYKVTREEKYMAAMQIAYDHITTHHTFATGGYGPAECLFTENEGYLGDSLKSTWDTTLEDPAYTNFGGGRVTRNDTWGSCEVSCCAWAVFKFCHYMLQFTGQAKYGEWVEQMLYNGTGAQLPISPDGKVMYYAGYFLDGALKTVEDRRMQEGGQAFEWQCCTGTFPQDVAEYVNMLYYQDDGSLYVSQYLPSRVDWSCGGTDVTLENYSMYPEEETVKLRISTGRPVSFRLKLRVPAWAAGSNQVQINGQPTEAEAKPSEWLELDRQWRDGDIVTVDFPFALRFRPVDAKNPDIVALTFGPLVLVADKMTLFLGDAGHLSAWIRPAGEPFTFLTEEGHIAGYDFLTRTFKPYYKVGAMEWYYMYNRIQPAP